MSDETTNETTSSDPAAPADAPEPAPAPPAEPAPEPDRRDPDLYEDQVPPHAPGVPGNEEPVAEVEHGTSSDGTSSAPAAPDAE